jgi:hypothetical protein
LRSLGAIIDGPFRASLQGAQSEGAGEGALEMVVESGDPGVVGREFTTLFVAAGSDPFALMDDSARAVMKQMKTDVCVKKKRFLRLSINSAGAPGTRFIRPFLTTRCAKVGKFRGWRRAAEVTHS